MKKKGLTAGNASFVFLRDKVHLLINREQVNPSTFSGLAFRRKKIVLLEFSVPRRGT